MSCNRLVKGGVPPYCTLDLQRAHQIARERGPVMPVYWVVRAILQPFFHLYFRLRRIGLEHVPKTGPVLMASNHRSFADPFMIGCCLGRPLHFVAKIELFDKRWKAWLLLALGAFPIRRGESDEEAMETARVILERGGVVGIFPEGTRVRPGPLGEPKRGVGRLVLETGAPVVPVAVLGTERLRRGWLIRPGRVTVRCGRALTFPRPLDREPRQSLAQEISNRVWSCISLQWEWLGGLQPIRHPVVVGAGSWGTAVATLLARSGATVQLVCRTPEQAREIGLTRVNDPLPARGRAARRGTGQDRLGAALGRGRPRVPGRALPGTRRTRSSPCAPTCPRTSACSCFRRASSHPPARRRRGSCWTARAIGRSRVSAGRLMPARRFGPARP